MILRELIEAIHPLQIASVDFGRLATGQTSNEVEAFTTHPHHPDRWLIEPKTLGLEIGITTLLANETGCVIGYMRNGKSFDLHDRPLEHWAKTYLVEWPR